MEKAEYISREAAIDAVDVGNLHRGIINALQAIISDIPAADVVEVVRCRECVHLCMTGLGTWCFFHPQGSLGYEDFCSAGKRRCDNGATQQETV